MSFSQIGSSEEAFIISGSLFGAIGFTLAIVYIIALRLQRKQIENKTVYKYAIASLTCSCLYFPFYCLSNDLIVPWEYETGSFASISDSLLGMIYATNKILFYLAFTYHLLSKLSIQSKRGKYLKICMFIVCILTFVIMIAMIIDDSTHESAKEIGYSANHNLHVTMIVGHEGAVWIPILAVIMMVMDSLYFILLLVIHVRKLREDQRDNNKYDNNGAKVVILLLCSCFFYWLLLLFAASRSAATWWLIPIDTISDDVCLFLLFKGQTALYESMCSRFDKFCLKCIYGKSQNEYQIADTENDETNELI